MSGIAKVSEQMKKKISFEDYTLPVEGSFSSEESTKAARKLYTISEKDMGMLQEILKKRLTRGEETSIAQIMSEAITLLFHREF